jgi:hypothetical protein
MTTVRVLQHLQLQLAGVAAVLSVLGQCDLPH